MDALRPCLPTHLSERVRQILRDHYSDKSRSKTPFLSCHGTANSSGIRGVYHADVTTRTQARQARAKQICQQYHSAACDSDDHVTRLDVKISGLLTCAFPKYKPDIFPDYHSDTEDNIVNLACDILSRLPPIPLPLGNVTSSSLLAVISAQYLLYPDTPAEWGNLKVVPHFSTPVILLALLISAARTCHKQWEMFGLEPLREIANTFIELLEVSTSLSSNVSYTAEAEAWLIVRSLLWVSWQRYTMLFRWYILGLHLQEGFDSQKDVAFSLRQYYDIGDTLNEIDQDWGIAEDEVPQYVCKWAFRLLRSDRSAACQDFRRLLAILDEAFPGRRPRCILNSTTVHLQCDGLSVDNCQRFKGLTIIDQSAHADGYGRSLCRRLYWDEKSYRSVNGARAVCIEEFPAGDRLAYCSASRQTLAISHVWSHGQGGRPETNGTGLNNCLHRRYCRIARRLGCTSYWMDTACIPEDHQLRREAISCINEVFAKSMVMLICDRDLMELEVEHGPNEVSTYERIIAVMLVCDWNVRAWTLLESMRGRRHIHVLCKDEAVVSVQKALEVVHQRGNVDLATLVLTSQHMLPWLDRVKIVDYYDPDNSPLDISEATLLLVNRHASRPGDDVVIWTLLVGPEPFFDLIDFWRDSWTKGLEVRTGFLMSDIPRLQDVPGLRWAPSQPRLGNSTRTFPSSRAPQHRVSASYEQVFDGIGSRYGRILRGGAFAAVWQIHKFVPWDTDIDLDTGLSKTQRVLKDIATQYTLGNTRALILRPASHFPLSEDQVILYKGSGGGPLVAVVSNHREHAWRWQGLYEWPLDVELPNFYEQYLRIV
ncbi:hypothetical protein NA57DRAFT_71686 [Rhizodiscina lignyota]|uniref:Heterokaryon incompatibility domain-containing protein n=1 Tax=Rhizodiscina lignyota TaxID=1504668 RepID=A0A9P4MEK7_9PEZI|nr:hypothetical protein NA57DRAFT_71686 [Rhizodiscina lignyota]